MEYTLDDMINELERELSMRKSFYKKQIEIGKMTREKANKQYGAMQAAKNLLQRIKNKQGNQKTFPL